MNSTELREHVMERAKKSDLESERIGKEREDFVEAILKEMKGEGIINDFLRTSKFSFADIQMGIDFYVVIIEKNYRVIPISVTGPYGALMEDKQPVVGVNLEIPVEKRKMIVKKE